jgi:hypothetical protein
MMKSASRYEPFGLTGVRTITWGTTSSGFGFGSFSTISILTLPPRLLLHSLTDVLSVDIDPRYKPESRDVDCDCLERTEEVVEDDD